MPHFVDGRWNTISGLVTQLVDYAKTWTSSASNTTELTFTPPTTEKYGVLTTTEKKNRRYRVHYSATVTTAGTQTSGSQIMTVRVGNTDSLDMTRSTTSSTLTLSTVGNTISGTVDVWMQPGNTITVYTTCNTNAAFTIRGVADLDIVVEAI